jgi:hypothetical protein
MESYRIAGIDVHKRMLAVVVIDAAREGEFEFERRKFGTTAGELGLLAEWLGQQEVREVVLDTHHAASTLKLSRSRICAEPLALR